MGKQPFEDYCPPRGKSAVTMGGEEIDPTKAASEKLNRRAFVGVSAATAAVAQATPAALAQQSTLGQPHPPLVPENDNLLVCEHLELRRPDVALPAYAAIRTGITALNTPSVVVIMHVWGVDTSIRDVVRRLALAGFPAIAPDLYGRFGAPSGDGATDYTVFRPYAQRLDRTQYDGDIRAAAMWLKQRFAQTKIGIMGFCMGGRIALLQTIDNADLFAAACPFYGPLKDVDPSRVAVPLCGSYGARDTGIPAAQVRAFWSALKVPKELKLYDEAGHAFFDDQRPSYVATAATDAWKRASAWFAEYLSGEPPVPAC
jgi:carboxymethylenebutenolidase